MNPGEISASDGRLERGMAYRVRHSAGSWAQAMAAAGASMRRATADCTTQGQLEASCCDRSAVD
jgi:hypothetical protein